MPSTITTLMEAGDLRRAGLVRWGTAVPEPRGGVYVVSLTDATTSVDLALHVAPIDLTAVEAWLDARPELTLDGVRPDTSKLAGRLSAFWLPDEVVLYIGKATSLSVRVSQYYDTPLGARSPHAGGHFLKTLSVLGNLYVHYAVADDPAAAESAMLASFVASVSQASSEALYVPDHPFPFANLEWPSGTRKDHGISGGRAPKKAAPTGTGRSVGAPMADVPAIASSTIRYRTQPVTASDLAVGQIRIPVSTPTKALLPSERTDLDVELRGTPARVRWDPRVGVDRERSGVIRFRGPDKDLFRSAVKPGEVLYLSVHDGVVALA